MLGSRRHRACSLIFESIVMMTRPILSAHIR
jgi:hypothetical protein